MNSKPFELKDLPIEYIDYISPHQKNWHILKTLPQYFEDVWQGKKKFEVRLNDRGYEVGHFLILKEYNPAVIDNEYTGRVIKAQVTFLLENVPELGLQDGYCIMGINPIQTFEQTEVSSNHQQRLLQMEEELIESDESDRTVLCQGCGYVYESFMENPDWCSDCFERERVTTLMPDL